MRVIWLLCFIFGEVSLVLLDHNPILQLELELGSLNCAHLLKHFTRNHYLGFVMADLLDHLRSNFHQRWLRLVRGLTLFTLVKILIQCFDWDSSPSEEPTSFYLVPQQLKEDHDHLVNQY